MTAAVLCKAGLDKKTPVAMPALIIGANLPDLDVLGVLFGKNYLDFHRGITHAVLGTVVLSAGLAGLFWLGSLVVSRKPERRLAFGPLLYVCFIGLLSHPLLDFLNEYGLRPWLPFSPKRYYGDLVGIVDPWMWVILGAALFLLSRTLTAKVLWGILGCFLLFLIVLGAGSILGLVWGLALGIVLCAAWYLRRLGFHPARVALLIFIIYLGGVETARRVVLSSARAMGPELISSPILNVDVLPGRWGNTHSWTVVIETEDKYYLADVGLQSWNKRTPSFEGFAKNLQNPYYLSSLSQSQMAVMSRFARFPSVSIQQEANHCTVFLRDLRYTRQNQSGWGGARATIPCADVPPSTTSSHP